MFQDMMDRIEDETIKFLFFMRIELGAPPPVPYPEAEDEDDDEPPANADQVSSAERARLAAQQREEQQREAQRREAQQREAQQSVIDLTRNIQRKKDHELAQLQFNGNGTSDSAPQPKTTVKVGRNELCPCGSGKKYKKCHGAAG